MFFCFSQGQTSKYDRLAHTPRTRDRCPHRVLSSASESQKTECYSRYSASDHSQKFAADLSLSTTQNSQPRKIFTLSAIKICIYLHPEFPLCKLTIEISFVLPIQEIVMQHFDLNSRYIYKKQYFFIKVFPCPQISSEFTLKPFFFVPLTTLQFVLLVFEVLGPDTLDIVFCHASSFLSSELITISSRAFSCS